MRQIAPLACLLFAAAALGQDMPLSQVLIDGEGWAAVTLPEGAKPSALAAGPKGTLFVADGPRVLAVADGKAAVHATHASPVAGLHSHDGTLYVSLPKDGRVVGPKVAAEVHARDVAVSGTSKTYYIDPSKKAVYLVGRAEPVAEGIAEPAGLAFWRDGSTLVVGDAAGKHLYAYRLDDKGGLDAKEKYYTLRTRPNQPSGVRALTTDAAGRLYAATALGVQVFDPTGRLCGVIAAPAREPVVAVAFAGDRLCVVCAGKVWQRKSKTKG